MLDQYQLSVYAYFTYADKHDILESQTWLGMITAITIKHELNT